MSSIFRAIILFLIMSSTISCSPMPRTDCVEIFGDDIPVYPNAENLTKEGPIKDWRETYTWEFTTTDKPEDVWQFYVDELVPNWDGEDHSSLSNPEEKSLYLTKACLFTFFILNITTIDNTTYRITIHLYKEPGM